MSPFESSLSCCTPNHPGCRCSIRYWAATLLCHVLPDSGPDVSDGLRGELSRACVSFRRLGCGRGGSGSAQQFVLECFHQPIQIFEFKIFDPLKI